MRSNQNGLPRRPGEAPWQWSDCRSRAYETIHTPPRQHRLVSYVIARPNTCSGQDVIDARFAVRHFGRQSVVETDGDLAQEEQPDFRTRGRGTSRSCPQTSMSLRPVIGLQSPPLGQRVPSIRYASSGGVKTSSIERFAIAGQYERFCGHAGQIRPDRRIWPCSNAPPSVAAGQAR
jgi:hypothetical protein